MSTHRTDSMPGTFLVLQVLGVAHRQPEQLRQFMAARDAAQLAQCLVRPLPGALHAAAARSGTTQLSPGFVQDAVHAAAATVTAYGSALLDACARAAVTWSSARTPRRPRTLRVCTACERACMCC